MKTYHIFEPVFNKDSKILILGTMPSPRSREEGFYYMHPQNRFWKVISGILGQDVPSTIDEKKEFLLNNNIALWDVLKSCYIDGAADSSIKDGAPNDLDIITDQADIKAIFTTGKKATDLYKKYFNKTSIYLPSSSSANCSFSYDDLVEHYKVILEYLK